MMKTKEEKRKIRLNVLKTTTYNKNIQYVKRNEGRATTPEDVTRREIVKDERSKPEWVPHCSSAGELFQWNFGCGACFHYAPTKTWIHSYINIGDHVERECERSRKNIRDSKILVYN